MFASHKGHADVVIVLLRHSVQVDLLDQVTCLVCVLSASIRCPFAANHFIPHANANKHELHDQHFALFMTCKTLQGSLSTLIVMRWLLDWFVGRTDCSNYSRGIW